jgi:hypothetical protein
MKKLALNAYQMKKLASYSLQENDVVLDWVNVMDDDTIKIEEDLQNIERTLKSKKLIGGS